MRIEILDEAQEDLIEGFRFYDCFFSPAFIQLFSVIIARSPNDFRSQFTTMYQAI